MRKTAVTMTCVVAWLLPRHEGVASPFATMWWSFEPAPGQFVNNPQFDDPQDAVGAPGGEGTVDGNLTSVVSLGGFGGSITLGFDHLVEDDPRNPFGLDAIVYGNATWVGGDPDRHWAECAVIEISLDANGDGLPNDLWYLIPGSHITDLDEQFTTQAWDDNSDTATPPTNLSWVPEGMTGEWETSGFLLDASVFGSLVVENPSSIAGDEGIYGYADFTPTLKLGDLDGDNAVDDQDATAGAFYTVPDDPFVVGITEGAGGGDAFDIAWAVDPTTGDDADLPGFHFIRLTNGVNAIAGFLGEKSPEIDAVADVAPDPFGDSDQDRDIDLADFARFQTCREVGALPYDSCKLLDWDEDADVALSDFGVWAALMTGPGGITVTPLLHSNYRTQRPSRTCRGGFSLLEMIVVMGIITLLGSVLLPSLAAAREQAKAAVCRSNISQMMLANRFYEEDHAGVYCPGASDVLNNLSRWHGAREEKGKPFDSARSPLVPYLGPEGLIRQCPTFPADEISSRNGGFERGNGGYGYNNAYIGVQTQKYPSGEIGIVSDRAGVVADWVQRPAETVMFTDAAFAGSNLIEYSFAEPRFHPQWQGFRADPSTHFRHADRANVGWCDGHVDGRVRTFTWSSGMYKADPDRLNLGWFGKSDDNSLYDLE